MSRSYVALGSNEGDRSAHLQAALDGLAATDGVEIVAVSHVYETDPVGGPGDQSDYLNAVVALDSTHDARGLLAIARRLEAEAGRPPPAERVRWGPRPLDVDILLVGDTHVDEPDLVVPHPRMHDRPFVLAPLADVAPQLVQRPADGWQGVRAIHVELRH
jgi:2-amino-4-hydroxy-6-hydroxymethyldihydropteridine diphosphokinase